MYVHLFVTALIATGIVAAVVVAMLTAALCILLKHRNSQMTQPTHMTYSRVELQQKVNQQGPIYEVVSDFPVFRDMTSEKANNPTMPSYETLNIHDISGGDLHTYEGLI